MKLIKKLTVDGQEYRILSDNIILENSAPGRAIIVVEASTPLSGEINYFLGYDKLYQLYLTGFIEDSIKINKKQQRLFIKEYATVLNQKYYISLRHVTIQEILKKFSSLSGLEFITEDDSWNNVIFPHFINHGSGYLLLETLGQELEIENFCYYSQPNGKIWLGNWSKSRYGKTTVSIPAELATQRSIKGATVPIIPQYRPGLRIRIGQGTEKIITNINITDSHMRLTLGAA